MPLTARSLAAFVARTDALRCTPSLTAGAEIEKLKARGVGVSEKDLEKRLAQLRAMLEGMSGSDESGSAAFRCIACDRVLPEASGWGQMKQNKSAGRKPHPTPSHNPAAMNNRGDGRLKMAMPKGERIYRAGFPMVRPTQAPQQLPAAHRRLYTDLSCPVLS
jgi:hypothetical protein